MRQRHACHTATCVLTRCRPRNVVQTTPDDFHGVVFSRYIQKENSVCKAKHRQKLYLLAASLVTMDANSPGCCNYGHLSLWLPSGLAAAQLTLQSVQRAVVAGDKLASG